MQAAIYPVEGVEGSREGEHRLLGPRLPMRRRTTFAAPWWGSAKHTACGRDPGVRRQETSMVKLVKRSAMRGRA